MLTFWRILFILWLLFAQVALANNQVLTLGVLAVRPKAEEQKRWQPLADYLTDELHVKKVQLVLLNYTELEQQLQNSKLDFLITNSSHYIRLRESNALIGAIATLVDSSPQGEPVSAFGGVIFCLRERTDINSLKDLKNKRIATTNLFSLGGYQAQLYELTQQGITLDNSQLLETEMPHNNVVDVVLSGKADVGFIRTDALESMAKERKLDLSRLKIINKQNLSSFPYLLSTHLYPQWPFVALTNVDSQLARKAAASLLLLEPKHPVTAAAGLYGFTIPADYEPVENLLHELRLPPFDTLPHFTLTDVWMRYRPVLLLIFMTGLFMLFLFMLVLMKNRQLSLAQQQIRKTEQRFQTLVNKMSIPLAFYNKQNQIVYFNEQFGKVFGYSHQEIPTLKEWLVLAYPDADYRHQCLNQWREDIEIAKTQSIEIPGREYQVTCKNGLQRIMLISGIIQEDGVLAILFDLTETRQAEQAERRESEKNLTLLHNASDGIHILNTEGNIIEASDSFCIMLGYQREEVIGLHVTQWDAYFPTDECIQVFKQQFSTTNRSLFETKHRCKDGTVIDVEVSGIPVELEGKLVLFNCSRDISKRRQAERYEQFRNHVLELLATEHDLNCILEAIVLGVEQLNPSKLCSILLLDSEGKRLVNAIAPSLPDFYNKAVDGVEIGFGVGSCGTAAFTGERVIVVDINTHPFWVAFKGLTQQAGLHSCWSEPILSSSNQVLGTFGIYHRNPHTPLKADIELIEQLASLTSIAIERKQNEAKLHTATEMAIAANQAKSEFLANMSHEIRTPMNAILGFSDILHNLIHEPTQRFYLDAIQRSGKTLLQLINDILDLSKIEAGKFTMQYSPVSLRSLLDDVSIVFSQKASSKSLNFSIEIDEKLPKNLLLDEIRIRQVLLNLLGNAFKFTKLGFVKITVLVDDLCANGKVILQIQVSDIGIGIPKAQQEKIFAAFTQQDNQSAEYGGTGLGLTICKRLMELMHGFITLESEAGKGSCFTLVLNNIDVVADCPETAAQLLALPVAPAKFHPAKVLLVDDSKINRMVIKAYLADYPELTVIEADSGMNAFALIQQHSFDLILMDRVMPGENGDTVCEKIKSLPDSAHIPIIMITASVVTIHHEVQQPIFYQLQLNKPVNKSALLSAIQLFLPVDESVKHHVDINKPAVKKQPMNLDLLPELLALLGSKYQKRITKLNQSGALEIDAFIKIADELLQVALHYHCEDLAIWAGSLKSQAELFDVEKLPKTLDSFEQLMKELS